MKVDAAEQARTSIADFYQTYRNLIFKKANEMANDPDYVEDLVQDTLYQLLRREELFLSLSEAQQVDYCIKTIRNTAINHHKRDQKIRFLSEDALGEQCDQSPTMEESILHRSDLDLFRKELDQLDEASRALLIRKYIQEEPDDSIAKDLDVKPSSIRMMLTRAKRKLLQLLLNDGFDPE